MNYKEFKTTYKRTLKKYYNLDKIFDLLDKKVIQETETHYTKSGTKWIETETKTATINGLYYMNVIDSIWFFRGLGGSEIIKKSYTKYGLLPTCINSINPSHDKKTVRFYNFD